MICLHDLFIAFLYINADFSKSGWTNPSFLHPVVYNLQINLYIIPFKLNTGLPCHQPKKNFTYFELSLSVIELFNNLNKKLFYLRYLIKT